jgi:hypothetical protein
MQASISKAAKAVYAAVVGFVGSLGASLTTGQSLGQLDAKTWLVALLVGLVAGGGVYGIRNAGGAPDG